MHDDIRAKPRRTTMSESKDLLPQHAEGRFSLAECPSWVLKGRFVAQHHLIRRTAGHMRINGDHFMR